jgi:(p)ppGpp synthase/HD superfamily hydrolase
MRPDSTARTVSGTPTTIGAAEKRLLATMRLHAITSVHGEKGLRERLQLEIARLSAREQGQIEGALVLASRLHAQDRRQREPYICHPLRVTIRVLSHYRVTELDVACAALLHDCVEDHAHSLAAEGTRQGALAVLAGQFGARTAELVAAVTNPVYESGRDDHEQYRDHVIASLESSPWARVIKISDFTDNAVGLIYTTGPKLSKLARKYCPLVPALRDLILRPDTPLAPDVKNMIAGQLAKAEDRFAAIPG